MSDETVVQDPQPEVVAEVVAEVPAVEVTPVVEVAPGVEVAPTPVVVEKKRYRYQPVDEHNTRGSRNSG